MDNVTDRDLELEAVYALLYRAVSLGIVAPIPAGDFIVALLEGRIHV